MLCLFFFFFFFVPCVWHRARTKERAVVGAELLASDDMRAAAALRRGPLSLSQQLPLEFCLPHHRHYHHVGFFPTFVVLLCMYGVRDSPNFRSCKAFFNPLCVLCPTNITLRSIKHLPKISIFCLMYINSFLLNFCCCCFCAEMRFYIRERRENASGNFCCTWSGEREEKGRGASDLVAHRAREVQLKTCLQRIKKKN